MKDMMGGMGGRDDMMRAMMMSEMSLGGGMGGMMDVDDLEDEDYDSDEIN